MNQTDTVMTPYVRAKRIQILDICRFAVFGILRSRGSPPRPSGPDMSA